MIQTAVAASAGHLAASAGGALQLSRPSLKRPLHLLVTPLPAEGSFPADRCAACAIFVSDPEADVETDDDVLRHLYGFSRAQARIASAMLRGQRAPDIADHLGVSLNTVRTHLKQIFAKTGVTRQADLVRLLLQEPIRRDLREPDDPHLFR